MAQIYNGQIYKLYEKEVEKNNRLSQKYEKLRWEVEELRYENKVLQKKVDEVDTLIEKAVDKAVAKVTKIFEEKIEILMNVMPAGFSTEIAKCVYEVSGINTDDNNLEEAEQFLEETS